jgi:acetate---CoA ligase (ADP-forming)
MTETTSLNLTQYYGKVVLKDGSTMVFRPLVKDDAQNWSEFYPKSGIAPECFNLQNHNADLSILDAQDYCSIDYVNQFALAAEVREHQKKRIAATGHYCRLPDSKTADFSILVSNDFQNRGIATKLIEWLVKAALSQGINRFETKTPSEKTALIPVLERYGFQLEQKTENGFDYISFPLAITERIIENNLERMSQASLKSLEYILNPRSAAVIGASNRNGALGQLAFQSLLQSGFKGPVYPVNANYETVLSVKAYPSILEIPGEVDLAVIAAPSSQILTIVDECGRKKVKGLIIIADGFREKDEKGAILEKEMQEIAFGYGMRIIGPNCMGVLNNHPEIQLNATFTPIKPVQGNLSFISQSGALGLGILEYANYSNIGFANFISVGNRADIGPTDLLFYLEKDPLTKVILLYLESFDNPELFSRISRRISRQKPILAIKGGLTPEGSLATRSHTGAMATSGLISEAFLKESGIIMVNTVNELFDLAMVLAHQPAPKGKNAVVVSSGGGPGIMAVDALSRHGLKLPQLTGETRSKIKSVLKRDLNINNPVDLTAGITSDEFEAVLKVLADDPVFDAILTIYIPPSGLDISTYENAVGRASEKIRQNGKTLLSSYVGMTPVKGKILEGHFVPYFVFPEEAAPALANAEKYYELMERKPGVIPDFKEIEREKAVNLINEVLSQNPQRPLWLSSEIIRKLFEYYGIHFINTSFAETPEQAAAAAEKSGFPVVIKLASATITHKTDAGGVVLNVDSREQVFEAYNTIRENLQKIGRPNEMQGVIVQPQISEGLELIIGVTEDAVLGHFILFGSGGIQAELIKDTTLKLHPLSDLKAKELINSVKISTLFKGYRNIPSSDVKSLEDLLLRISALVTDLPRISEMDLNPVKVQAENQGYWVLDARILIK